MRRLRSPRLARLLPGVLLMLLLSAPASSAEAPRIYKWIDSNGIAHYTTDPERIPKALRKRIESVERGLPETPVVTVETPPTPPPVIAPSADPPTKDASTEPPTPVPAPAPPERPTIAVPAPARTPSENWVTRDALPRLQRGGSSLLAEGEATPQQREAIAAEQQALDSQIADVEAQILQEENALKDLIADPELDKETPLFDRPEFLEVSRRLPQLQAQLEELRGQRQQLETP